MQILFWAIPIFVVTMLIERKLIASGDYKGYWAKDSVTNLSMGVGNLFVICLACSPTGFARFGGHHTYHGPIVFILFY